MKITTLGSTNIRISRICMGCMGFGNAQTGQHSWTLNEEDTRAIIRRALDGGINFYDTAIAYQNGSSEQYVGRALRDMARRDEVVVATKFLPRTPAQIEAGISGQQHIAASLEQSLKNLGMDYVDLYIYHIWDYNTPIRDVLQALNTAVKAGKVRAIGIANCFAWQLAKANALAEKEGWARFVSVQNHYNLIMREEERAAGRLSRAPGVQTKRLQQDSYAKMKYDAAAAQDAVIIQRVAELAQKRGVSMTEIALAWLLEKVAAPVVGMTKESHVDAAVKATQLALSADEMKYLEEAYTPHNLSGVMAQNTPAAKGQAKVWTKSGNHPKE